MQESLESRLEALETSVSDLWVMIEMYNTNLDTMANTVLDDIQQMLSRKTIDTNEIKQMIEKERKKFFDEMESIRTKVQGLKRIKIKRKSS